MSIVDVNNDGIALDGFDPVSYFDGEPLRGSSEFSSEFDKSIYYFANEENVVRFQEDPSKYIPRYGAYCALGMANRQRNAADFTNYHIQDGQLFFFGRNNLEDARVSWEKDVPAYLKSADDFYESERKEMEMQNLEGGNNN